MRASGSLDSPKKRYSFSLKMRVPYSHFHSTAFGYIAQRQPPDRIGTVQDKEAVQKMQDDPKTSVDYQSYVGAPNGDLVQFTPNSNASDGLGDAKVVQHNVAPDPNQPKPPAQQPTPEKKKKEPK
jgi:hypothetical protein